MTRPRSAAVRLVALLCTFGLVAACTAETEPANDAPDTSPESPGDPGGPNGPDGAGTEDPETAPEAQARECGGEGPTEAITDLTGDPVAASEAVASRTHRCADTVVVAAADVPWAASLAAPLAAGHDAPLLLTDGDPDRLVAELERLAPEDVVSVAVPPETASAIDDLDLPGATRHLTAGTPTDDGSDALALAKEVLDHLAPSRALAFTEGDLGSRAAALSRAGEGLALLPLPDEPDALRGAVTSLPTSLRLETVARTSDRARELAGRLVDLGVDAEAAAAPRFDTPDAEIAWLADPQDEGGYAVAAAAAGTRGEPLLPVVGDAPWHGRERTTRLREVGPDRVALVGAGDAEAASWQLPAVLSGEPLPTGAFTLFETERMVALYGTPTSRVLGALGEQQDLDATIDRLREVAEPYGADGREVLPAFEIIVTIASAEAGDQGDYSRRLPPESFRPWIDRAAEEGIYVILDLQPGRTDFLDQAREYEDLLREPHVGLALDPEWRLEDDQVHLRQIGSVDAEEVQRVADWLAALVRDEGLPQKLLVLHQFRFSMLPDRDEIQAPPELAVVIHMDGQGPINDKYATYAALTAGAEDRWWWGWKNFYDEDFPTPTPEQVLELDPLPVLVTYQ